MAERTDGLAGKRTIAKRFRYLWTGEATAIAAILLFVFVVAPPAGHWSGWIARYFAVGVLLLILAQGVFWWRYRLRLLQSDRETADSRSLRGFRTLRSVNWLLIAAFPLVIILKGVISPGAFPDADFWWGLAFIAGAVLEQVNYYHYQLTYGYGRDRWYLRRHRRLRRGNIARYLDEEGARSKQSRIGSRQSSS